MKYSYKGYSIILLQIADQKPEMPWAWQIINREADPDDCFTGVIDEGEQPTADRALAFAKHAIDQLNLPPVT